jgi:hypothetical protein
MIYVPARLPFLSPLAPLCSWWTTTAAPASWRHTTTRAATHWRCARLPGRGRYPKNRIDTSNSPLALPTRPPACLPSTACPPLPCLPALPLPAQILVSNRTGGYRHLLQLEEFLQHCNAWVPPAPSRWKRARCSARGDTDFLTDLAVMQQADIFVSGAGPGAAGGRAEVAGRLPSDLSRCAFVTGRMVHE